MDAATHPMEAAAPAEASCPQTAPLAEAGGRAECRPPPQGFDQPAVLPVPSTQAAASS